LGIHGMRVSLPLDRHPVLDEQVDVEIRLRRVAAEVARRLESAAQLQQALAPLPLDAYLRRANDLGPHLEPRRQQLGDREVELDVVVHDEHVRAPDEVEVAEPREIAGLKRRECRHATMYRSCHSWKTTSERILFPYL